MTAATKTMSDFANGPLTGLRVIEMGQLIAGPFCAQLMGDFGAEVIKIEDPDKGDPMRGWGQVKKDGQSLWWPVIARNKKSVTLNLRDPQGQQMARDLIATSDVLIENFRPGTMEKWGLGYDALSAINPGLIMIRMSGYGQTGPYATRAGYGGIGEAMGGMRSLLREPEAGRLARRHQHRRLPRRHLRLPRRHHGAAGEGEDRQGPSGGFRAV